MFKHKFLLLAALACFSTNQRCRAEEDERLRELLTQGTEEQITQEINKIIHELNSKGQSYIDKDSKYWLLNNRLTVLKGSRSVEQRRAAEDAEFARQYRIAFAEARARDYARLAVSTADAAAATSAAPLTRSMSSGDSDADPDATSRIGFMASADLPAAPYTTRSEGEFIAAPSNASERASVGSRDSAAQDAMLEQWREKYKPQLDQAKARDQQAAAEAREREAAARKREAEGEAAARKREAAARERDIEQLRELEDLFNKRRPDAPSAASQRGSMESRSSALSRTRSQGATSHFRGSRG